MTHLLHPYQLLKLSKHVIALIARAVLFTTVVSANASEQNHIVVTDDSGARIELQRPAKRLIALSPHAVENTFSAGAGEKLVGVMAYSDFPTSVKNLPVVGTYERINVERILELDPDLIIAWGSGNAAGTLNQLRDLGFVVYIDEPKTLEDVAKSVKKIGRMAGTEAIANEAATNFLSDINSLRMRFQHRKSISVLYQIWHQPLQTLGSGHIINDAIELCGGVNVFADTQAIAPIISTEAVLERDPDVIIASSTNKERPHWLDDWRKWEDLKAVKTEQLAFINPDLLLRHTLRLQQGLTLLCEQIESAR